MTRHLVLFSLVFGCYLPLAHAGKVMKVKDTKIFIIFDQNEEGTFAEGDFFTLTDPQGKKRALVQLKKIKGLKAIAVLKKGKADTGYGTVFRSPGKKSKKGALSASNDEGGSERSGSSSKFNNMKSHWGGVFGYGMASQKVSQLRQSVASTSDQSGTSMSVKLAYQYPLLQSVSLRALAGVDMFSVSGTGFPNSGAAATTTGTDITYLTVDGLATWSFIQGSSMSFFGFAGAGILYPLSKTTDILNTESLTSLAVGEFGLGTDLHWGTWAIPIFATYYFYPTSDSVKTSLMSVRIGILF